MKFIFDNSNLNESYAGVTTPLTFSFARRVYCSVYVEFCRFMGVEESEIEKNSRLFPNMLGFIGGRMFYNLRNWHKMISFFPGYKLNGQFLEEMLGVDPQHRGAIAIAVPPWVKLTEWIKVGTLLLRMIGIFVGIKWFVYRFNSNFNAEYKKLELFDLTKASLRELQTNYLTAEAALTKNFRIPIANDFAVMISVGLIKKLSKTWLGDIDEQLATEFLAGRSGIKSAEPGKALYAIVTVVSEHKELITLFNESKVDDIWEKLQKNTKYSRVVEMITEYLSNYGQRVPGELKLESHSFQVEPTVLMNIIKGQIHQIKTQRKVEAKNVSHNLSTLTLFQRALFTIIWNWAQQSITIREDTRFKRTLVFGMARKFFLEIGSRLFSDRKINKVSDVFFLTVDELMTVQKLAAHKLKLKILTRKKYLQKCQDFDLPSRIESESLPIVVASIKVTNQSFASKNKVLKGRVACLGGHSQITGEAVVMREFDPNQNINGKILVAAQTDPGWTVIFPALKAIVVERGGILSHASIVAREFNIPCIINCKNATSLIKSKQNITLNLKTGEVI